MDAATLLRLTRLGSEVFEEYNKSNNKTIQQARKLTQDHIRNMFVEVAQAGFQHWRPDLREGPDTDYNVAHIQLAIQTFRRLLRQGAYAHLQPNVYLSNDPFLLWNITIHYIFYFLRKGFKSELVTPGITEARARANAAQTFRARVRWLLHQSISSN